MTGAWPWIVGGLAWFVVATAFGLLLSQFLVRRRRRNHIDRWEERHHGE